MMIGAPPRDLPDEFGKYDRRVKQLGVGEVGKCGDIRAELEGDGEAGETVLRDSFSRVPLQVMRALHPDESFPEMAYVYLMSPSGGILQGDRLRIEILLDRRAHAHITTQSATKVYGMKSNYATQELTLEVGKGCYLEFVPDQLIPYAGSRFHQSTRLKVHDEGTAIYSEIVVPGRATRGESFEYDILSLKTLGLGLDSRVRFRDAVLLEPRVDDPLQALEPDAPVFGSLFVVTSAIPARALVAAVDAELRARGATGGASVLPGKDGIFVRMTGGSSEELKGTAAAIVSRLRHDIIGRDSGGTRKY